MPTPPPEAVCPNVNPAIAIPDNNPNGTGITHTVTRPATGTITDLNVCLNITHTWPGDLYVTLQHGSGTTIVLMDRPGGGSLGCPDDDIYAYLDDETSVSVQSFEACTPTGVMGVFSPLDLLSAFDGQSDGGEWKLFVRDEFDGDIGELTGFSMTFTTTTETPTPTPIPTPTPVPPSCPTTPMPIDDNNPSGNSRSTSPGTLGTIMDLNVCITITHPRPGDLKITLTRGATTVVLMDRPGIANPSFPQGCTTTYPNVAVVFDDEAVNSVTNTCPVLGSLKPQGALSAFDNLTIAGTWDLRVYDLVAGSVGTMTGFQLNFTPNPATPTPTPTP